MKIANMATYPGRENSTLQTAVASIARQVDVLNLCLNEFEELPAWIDAFGNVNAFLPDRDHKDVGKFVVSPAADDDVFYVDDDILYPRDYVAYSLGQAERLGALTPIVGFHGVIYADVFDGTPQARNVFLFRNALGSSRVVNQLGTGTLHCKGWQCPAPGFMAGSERFVDVRFALHANDNGWPMICLPREKDWMRDLQAGNSIFEGFTHAWPLEVTREAQRIAGYGRLPLGAVAAVE